MLEKVQNISNMANIHDIRQKEPKGLGRAVHCAKSFIEDIVYKVKGMVEKSEVDYAPSNIAILARYI